MAAESKQKAAKRGQRWQPGFPGLRFEQRKGFDGERREPSLQRKWRCSAIPSKYRRTFVVRSEHAAIGIAVVGWKKLGFGRQPFFR